MIWPPICQLKPGPSVGSYTRCETKVASFPSLGMRLKVASFPSLGIRLKVASFPSLGIRLKVASFPRLGMGLKHFYSRLWRLVVFFPRPSSLALMKNKNGKGSLGTRPSDLPVFGTPAHQTRDLEFDF